MALCWKRLPKWQQDNEFIIYGYRKASYSYHSSVRSMMEVHNETVNIWSHLLAAILFLINLIRFLSKCSHLSVDVIAILIFYLGVITCFTLSSIYHLFSNHSRRVANWWQRLDHLGVVVVIWGSTIPFIYFACHCNPGMQRLYTSAITVSALLSVIYVSRPEFRRLKSRPVRVFTYFALGFSAIMPAIHLYVRADEQALYQRTVLTSFRNLASLHSLGGLIYAMRVPERFFRGVFDIYGSSHQIMHIMVICGALIYQTDLLTAREYWHNDTVKGVVCLGA